MVLMSILLFIRSSNFLNIQSSRRIEYQLCKTIKFQCKQKFGNERLLLTCIARDPNCNLSNGIYCPPIVEMRWYWEIIPVPSHLIDFEGLFQIIPEHI